VFQRVGEKEGYCKEVLIVSSRRSRRERVARTSGRRLRNSLRRISPGGGISQKYLEEMRRMIE
jgi:hypothetical protein